MLNNNIRVRIAPSPTGFLHVGNLRTILYNYLFAKHEGGKFIIRIEDTDQNRFVEGAVENLLKVVDWAGIESDEGPYLDEKGKVQEKGVFGPYFQSARLDIYKEYIKVLLEKGKAYYCFCPKERLDSLREEQTKNNLPPKYDNCCRTLGREEIKKRLQANEPHVIRFKMPENKDVVFADEIRGSIVVNTKDLDDYVLIKTDGFPTYHFANVVDDHLMKITHVLRGDEWIASTPKHVLLYEAFDWQPPKFAHLPILLSKTKKKLSKRDGDTSVKDFIAKGYLKDAFLNFISLLGWNSGSEQEVYSINELIQQFDLAKVHKSGAVFDLEKLDWLNGVYIRQLSPDEFYDLALPYLQSADLLEQKNDQLIIHATGEKIKSTDLKGILTLEQIRIKNLSELAEALRFFFIKETDLNYEAKELVWKKSDSQKTKVDLQELSKILKKIKTEDWQLENIKKEINEFLLKNNLDTGSVLWPMRYALSGRAKSPDPFEIAYCLGKKQTLARLEIAFAKL
ncbi:MAG: glutamate--tRNA ligase [Patescibacteria group bacterium]